MNWIISLLLKWIDPPLPKLEVLCRVCGQWHPVGYGISTKTGKEENIIMGYSCGDKTLLCGVAGQAIDGNKLRPARNVGEK